MLSVLSSNLVKTLYLSLESLVITELMMTELYVKSEYEYGLDHVGGTRCCEINESLGVTPLSVFGGILYCLRYVGD